MINIFHRLCISTACSFHVWPDLRRNGRRRSQSVNCRRSLDPTVLFYETHLFGALKSARGRFVFVARATFYVVPAADVVHGATHKKSRATTLPACAVHRRRAGQSLFIPRRAAVHSGRGRSRNPRRTDRRLSGNKYCAYVFLYCSRSRTA